MTDPDMNKLDDLLADVARREMAPSDDLMARVLADAASVQAGFARPLPVASRPGVLAALMGAIGGWPGLSGLAAAGVAGLWIGVAPPLALESFAADVLGTTESVDFLSVGATFDVTEAFDG